MTTIETDNPIIEIWVKYYDILWHYWPVVLLAFILGVWLMFRHFSRRQKEWELNKQQMRRKEDEMREQIRKYSSLIAAAGLNRKAYGFEIKKNIYSDACDLIKHNIQFDLFAESQQMERRRQAMYDTRTLFDVNETKEDEKW